MHSKREKEAVLAQFHASGLRVHTACRELPGFPCDETLRKWLEEEARGPLDPPELRRRGSARGLARRRRYPEATRREAARLVRAGVSPPVAARRLGASSGCLVSRRARASRGMPSREDRGAGKERGMGGPEERTPAEGGERAEWRDWAADLPEDPQELLAALERKRIEMGAALDVLKAPGPGSLSRREKAAAGAARAAGDSVAAACRDLGLARSMPRKGRSPDNARAGGFFGTLKQEFFYARDWTGVGCEEFAAELDEQPDRAGQSTLPPREALPQVPFRAQEGQSQELPTAFCMMSNPSESEREKEAFALDRDTQSEYAPV